MFAWRRALHSFNRPPARSLERSTPAWLCRARETKDQAAIERCWRSCATCAPTSQHRKVGFRPLRTPHYVPPSTVDQPPPSSSSIARISFQASKRVSTVHTNVLARDVHCKARERCGRVLLHRGGHLLDEAPLAPSLRCHGAVRTTGRTASSRPCCPMRCADAASLAPSGISSGKHEFR